MNMEKTVYTCHAGSFTGMETDRCIHIRGIRYASSKRFAAPVPYCYPIGIHACTAPAPYAMQGNSHLESYLFQTEYESYRQEESPQFLSVHLPKNATGPLPVMVWFHGGGFKNGNADAPNYNYEYLVSEQNVILVGVNYRLGIFGFAVDEHGNPGHPGLLDAIEGLRWVKRNIASFGGDPDNITIFGQSAGAELCRAIVLSEGTENLYHRVILQSDPIGTMHNREAMEQDVYARVTEIPDYCPAEKILDVQKRILKEVKEKGTPKYLIFAPRYGVWPLCAADNIEARLKDVAADHELLIGCTSREVSVYGGQIRPLILLDNFRPTRDLIETKLKAMSREIFNEPSEAFARQYREAGGTVYEYLFSWNEDRSFIGAGHAMDLPLLFGAEHAEGTDAALGLTAQEIYEAGKPMRELWGTFARTGVLPETVSNEILSLHKL